VNVVGVIVDVDVTVAGPKVVDFQMATKQESVIEALHSVCSLRHRSEGNLTTSTARLEVPTTDYGAILVEEGQEDGGIRDGFFAVKPANP